MELRQLEYFVAVAEELNFRRAAEKLYIQQPPLSRQIQQLETELGIKLLHRTKREVSLTEVGKTFLDEARLTLAQAQRAIDSVTTQSRLTVGFSICAFNRVLPKLIQEYRQQYSKIQVDLTEMSKEQQIKALLNHQIDLGFCYAPINQPELTHRIISSEALAVVLPLDHPLAEREQIELKSLQKESFILCPKEFKPNVRQQIEQLCMSAGFQLKVIREVSPPEVQLRLVESGMGISLLAASSQTRHNAAVIYRPLVDPVPTLKIATVWHRNHQSQALSEFIKAIN